MMWLSPDSIGEIERALSIQLPRSYRELLADVPSDLADAHMHVSNDQSWLVGQNSEMRRDPGYFFGREAAWPQSFYIFGTDGNGNAIYFDCSEGADPPVYFLDHEEPDSDRIELAASLQAWLPQLRVELEKRRANAEALRQFESKPWLRFWLPFRRDVAALVSLVRRRK